MPMTKWSGSSKGLVSFKDGVFKLEFDVAEEHKEKLYEWTKEICEYRLHAYFERKEQGIQTLMDLIFGTQYISKNYTFCYIFF